MVRILRQVGSPIAFVTVRRPRPPAISRRGRWVLLLLALTPSKPAFAWGPLVAAAVGLLLPAAVPAGAGARAFAQQPQEATVRGATVEGITEYTLANGLRVLLFPDPSKPTITVNITYLVGSRHEGYGETGMAHLLEHLLFKGTPKHPQIFQELTERGANPNGTTWYDRTNYFETFPASDENLEWALDLEADRMLNSFVAREHLESEMTVVRNEFESGENDPFNVLFERVLSTAFLWHNYGKSTIGARSDIENVPIERLQAFYRKYYQPDNALLVVAGQFEEERALALIEQKFGSIPRPAREGANLLYPTYTLEPTQDGERAVTLRRVGDVQVVIAAYHVPPGSHEDYAAVDILSHVLGDTPSGRLHKALVETGKAASAGAYGFQLREPGVLFLFAQVRADQSLEEARDILLSTVEGLVTQPPTQEEVERARTALLTEIELSLNSSERVGLRLTEWAANGDWRLIFIHRDRLRALTTEHVGRVASAYFKPSNRTVGLFLPTPEPDRAEIPAAPDITALVSDYRGDSTRVAGEAFDPSPANIESRVERSTLPNGFEVVLLPKRTRGGSVVADITLRLGAPDALNGRATAASLAGSMLMHGTRQRTRQQLQDEFDRLRAQVRVSGSVTQGGGSIETTRENLPAVLRLVGEVLREPAFDAREFAELKRQRLAGLESQKSEPQPLAARALSRHLDPWPEGHPRYTPTFEEEIAAVNAATLDQARAFYEQFYGAGAGGTLSVVGDFDPDEIRAIATEILASWRMAQPFRRIASPLQERPATTITIRTPDKANAYFIAGLNLDLRDDDPDYPALVLADYMMGGGILNSRLAMRLRQQDGLSYGVGSFLSAHPIDRYGQWRAAAIYAPANLERLEAGFREEIERALRDGFTPEEVATAKSGYLDSRQVARAEDDQLAGMLGNALYLDRTLAWDGDFEASVRAVTPEQVLEAMRRHIDPAKITVVRAGDFPQAGAPRE